VGVEEDLFDGVASKSRVVDVLANDVGGEQLVPGSVPAGLLPPGRLRKPSRQRKQVDQTGNEPGDRPSDERHVFTRCEAVGVPALAKHSNQGRGRHESVGPAGQLFSWDGTVVPW
jgi:hypothetical protein